MRTTVTRAAAADRGGAARNLKGEASPPYCGEQGGRFAAVALGLGLGLGRSLAPPAVRVVSLQRAAAVGSLPLRRCLLHFASAQIFFHPSLPCPSPVVRFLGLPARGAPCGTSCCL